MEQEEEASPPAPHWAFIPLCDWKCTKIYLNLQAAYHLVHFFPLTASIPKACQEHTCSRPRSQYSKMSLLQGGPAQLLHGGRLTGAKDKNNTGRISSTVSVFQHMEVRKSTGHQWVQYFYCWHNVSISLSLKSLRSKTQEVVPR